MNDLCDRCICSPNSCPMEHEFGRGGPPEGICLRIAAGESIQSIICGNNDKKESFVSDFRNEKVVFDF